jgi:hypothetical protein
MEDDNLSKITAALNRTGPKGVVACWLKASRFRLMVQ